VHFIDLAWDVSMSIIYGFLFNDSKHGKSEGTAKPESAENASVYPHLSKTNIRSSVWASHDVKYNGE
jgi:hypothetical protein